MNTAQTLLIPFEEVVKVSFRERNAKLSNIRNVLQNILCKKFEL
jgi:hypothetical protein